jgi:hypothetical protein
MYTRDFGSDEGRRSVPDSYCGNLFAEDGETAVHNELSENKGGAASILNSLFGKKLDLKTLPFLKKGLGSEEILIIAFAAFLFFSKGGDKECAIILLLSLFLT